MIRGARPGRSTVRYAGAEPDKGRGHFSPRPAPSAPSFILHVARIRGLGQICLACRGPIHGPGFRLHRGELMETHAHARCLDAALWCFAA